MRQLVLCITVMVAARGATAASFQGLGDLAEGTFFSEANGVSSDGSVVVGQGIGQLGIEAFRWTPTDGMIGLGDLTGGPFAGTAIDASANGSVIVGSSYSDLGEEPFRWTQSGGMVGLGHLPGGTRTLSPDFSPLG